MINCREQSELMTLLSNGNFILFINAFRLIIFKPPSHYCLTTALLALPIKIKKKKNRKKKKKKKHHSTTVKTCPKGHLY